MYMDATDTTNTHKTMFNNGINMDQPSINWCRICFHQQSGIIELPVLEVSNNTNCMVNWGDFPLVVPCLSC